MSYFRTKGDPVKKYGRKIQHLNNFFRVLAVTLCVIALGSTAYLFLVHKESDVQNIVTVIEEKVDEFWENFDEK